MSGMYPYMTKEYVMKMNDARQQVLVPMSSELDRVITNDKIINSDDTITLLGLQSACQLVNSGFWNRILINSFGTQLTTNISGTTSSPGMYYHSSGGNNELLPGHTMMLQHNITLKFDDNFYNNVDLYLTNMAFRDTSGNSNIDTSKMAWSLIENTKIDARQSTRIINASVLPVTGLKTNFITWSFNEIIINNRTELDTKITFGNFQSNPTNDVMYWRFVISGIQVVPPFTYYDVNCWTEWKIYRTNSKLWID